MEGDLQILANVVAEVDGELGFDNEVFGVGLPDFTSNELGCEIDAFGVGFPDFISAKDTERLLIVLCGVVCRLNGSFGVIIKDVRLVLNKGMRMLDSCLKLCRIIGVPMTSGAPS